MTTTESLVCDGCGQPADSQHITKRLQRLEWTTRYRPVHIHTLLLSGVSPSVEADFLYAPAGEFQSEAARLLELAGISFAGKSREAVHAEFQRAGLFLTHVLECPWGVEANGEVTLATAIEKRAPFVATRIRRSLKPRRVALISGVLGAVLDKFSGSQLECPVVLDGNLPFALDDSDSVAAVSRLREALSVAPCVAR